MEMNPTNPQQRKPKKFLVYTVLFGLCAMALWLIFSPAEAPSDAHNGFNTEVPDPTDARLVDDKQKAYEQALLEKKQQERALQLHDLGTMFGFEQEPEPPADDADRPHAAVRASNEAYQAVSRSLGSFYDAPKSDPKQEELQQRIAELSAALEAKPQPVAAPEDPMELLERSYQMAAKYLPQAAGSPPLPAPAPPSAPNGKHRVLPVGRIRPEVVSALTADTLSASVGFCTAVGAPSPEPTNTVAAVVHNDQTVADGGTVRLRLVEPMRIGQTVVPSYTLLTGVGKIAGERLAVVVSAVEHEGTILPVELTVRDADGQEGIFVPGSMEVDALKELAANAGSNLGTTVNLNQQNAGSQLLTDLGRGAIQGLSQYAAKKTRAVRIRLKAGYRVLLYSEKQ